MKKFVCSVCNYVHYGDSAPSVCPVCHQGADKFREVPYYGPGDKPKWYEKILMWFK